MKKEARKLSQITFDYLSLFNNKISEKYCEFEIETHPDYPALTSCVDFLESGGFQYNAVRADKNYLSEFKYPLIAHFKKVGDDSIKIIHEEQDWHNKDIEMDNWSGIVIYPGEQTKWSHIENDKELSLDKASKFKKKVAIFVFASIFILTCLFQVNFTYCLFGLLSFTGFLFGTFAVTSELGIQGDSVKKFCGSFSKGGCDAVLTSNQARGYLGVSLADAATIYFGAQILTFIIAAFLPHTFSIMPYIAFFGGLAIIYSIYVQRYILKEWCAICLAIVMVLALQFLGAFFIPKELNLVSATIFIGLLIVSSLIYFSVKKVLQSEKQNHLNLKMLGKWRKDANIFTALLENSQKIDNSDWQKDLLVGNTNAPIKITVACNPYCGPCASTHTVLDDIHEKYPEKVALQIRLLCDPEDENDSRKIAVQKILEYANQTEIKDTKVLLSSWFEFMDMEKWLIFLDKRQNFKNISENNTNTLVQERLIQHSNWMKNSGITHTPTIFINGRKLPNQYNLTDVEKMIPQLVN